MAFRAYLSHSIHLSTLRRCNKNTPTDNNSAVICMVNSTTESLRLLPPGGAKQRSGTLGSRRASVKDVVSSGKDSQERTPAALAYPPEHYFDTHHVVMKLQALDIKALQNDLELIKKGRLDVLHLETKTLDKECQNFYQIIKIAQLKMQMAAQKLESFKYFAGLIISVITIIVSVAVRSWRLMK